MMHPSSPVQSNPNGGSVSSVSHDSVGPGLECVGVGVGIEHRLSIDNTHISCQKFDVSCAQVSQVVYLRLKSSPAESRQCRHRN